MNVTIGNFQLKPYSNGLCWELFEFRPVKGKDGEVEKWVSAGVYPSTLTRGLQIVYERMLKMDDGSYGAEAAVKRAEEIEKRIANAARGREKCK